MTEHKPDYDVLIVGAGLFGAVVARELMRRGRRCLVLEKRGDPGGNILSERRHGIDVHLYGAHIFHTSSAKAWKYVNDLTPFHPFINRPLANYKGRLFSLPFNMYTFNAMWGVTVPGEARAIIESQCTEYKAIGEPGNLEQQALSLVGKDIYETLVKGYTEKQWGRSADRLPAFIIRRLPLRFTFDNNYFNDTFQGIPTYGYDTLISDILKGVDVRIKCDFMQDRSSLSEIAKTTLFTGPLDAFFDYKLGALEWRSLKFDHQYLPNTDNFQGNAVINYTDSETPFTRIIEHKHFNPVKTTGTVITREYPIEYSPAVDPYYPVNDAANESLKLEYMKMARQQCPDVFFGGRLGNYKYADMDTTILDALDMVEKIELRLG